MMVFPTHLDAAIKAGSPYTPRVGSAVITQTSPDMYSVKDNDAWFNCFKLGDVVYWMYPVSFSGPHIVQTYPQHPDYPYSDLKGRYVIDGGLEDETHWHNHDALSYLLYYHVMMELEY